MRNTRGRMMAIGTAAATLAITAGTAQATLNIDLRATAVNGQTAGVVGSHNVLVQHIGDVVSFDIFAVINGNNTSSSDDRIVSVSGSFISPDAFTPGPHLLGNLQTNLIATVIDPNNGAVLTAGFDGAGSSVGLRQDLDGDGDLDVGSNVDSDSAGFFQASYIDGPPGAVAGSSNPTVGGRRIGFGTFTITNNALFIGEATNIRFDGRANASAAFYMEDGVMIQGPSFDGFVPILVSGPFEPEPASLTWAVGALALLRRRSR